jgi:hypothetical protein
MFVTGMGCWAAYQGFTKLLVLVSKLHCSWLWYGIHLTLLILVRLARVYDCWSGMVLCLQVQGLCSL